MEMTTFFILALLAAVVAIIWSIIKGNCGDDKSVSSAADAQNSPT